MCHTNSKQTSFYSFVITKLIKQRAGASWRKYQCDKLLSAFVYFVPFWRSHCVQRTHRVSEFKRQACTGAHRTSNSWLDRRAHGLDFVFDDECTRGGQVRRDVTRYFGTILGTFFSKFHPLPVIAEKNE